MVYMPGPWKHPKTGVLYFRRAVPPDLRSTLGWELKKSLGTKDPAEAKRLFAVEFQRSEERFAAVRNPVWLSEKQAMGLAGKWLKEKLEEDLKRRDDPQPIPAEANFRPIAGLYDNPYDLLLSDLSDAVQQNEDYTVAAIELADFLKEENLSIAEGSPEYALLLKHMAGAKAVYLRTQAQRCRGNFSKVTELDRYPEPVPVVQEPPKTTNATRLADLLERWTGEEERPPRTVLEWKTAVGRFMALHGDLPVEKVTKAHIRDFKDDLVKQGKAPATITKQISAIRSLLQCGVNNGYLEVNVASGVTVPGSKKKSERQPYEIEDLKKIFASPVFTEGERPKGGAGEAAYWLPVLALYTGARLEELGQAYVSDVRSYEGILYLDINNHGEDKSIKTDSSLRFVPLHPVLIELGFLRYVEEMKSKGEKRLFPLVEAKGDVQLTAAWSKWWGRYAREHVTDDKGKVFHSFRHTFKDACRIAGVSEEMHDRLTGHAGGGVGRSYGNGIGLLKPLAEAIGKVEYPGVVIPMSGS